MKVWVLYGGDIESAADLAFETRRFLAEGSNCGVDVEVMRPEQFDLLVTEKERDSILIDGEQRGLPDFIMPYMDDENRGYFSLAIVRQLERLGVPVFNSAATIETVADKLHTHQILAEKGLPTPTTMLAKFPVNLDLIEQTIGFPLVVKTLLGHNGTGVFLIENREAFNDLMDLIGETNPDIQMIFQQFVSQSKGRDLRIFVVDGEVVAAMERRAKEGGFKANFSQGGQVDEFVPDAEVSQLSIQTAEVLDIQVAGIDLLFTDEGYTICEANTFPGFKGLEKASGVNIPGRIYEAMRKRLETKQANGQLRQQKNTPAQDGQSNNAAAAE